MLYLGVLKNRLKMIIPALFLYIGKNLYISDVFKVDELIDGDFDLLAGTAWFFAMKGLIKD